jgi:hypothetical protein
MKAAALPSKPDRRMDAALTSVMALCIARLWLAPLGSSFWLDETVTAFVARHGANHPSLTVAPQVPESIYYWLPRIFEGLFGPSELVYRLPSVLAMGAAVLVVSRVASRLVHPSAGWFSAFACLALSGINYQAADARPYALGSCLWAVSIFCLVRWLDSAKWRDGLLFALFAALVWRVQLVFWPFYIVAALYAFVRLLRRETPVGPVQAGIVFGFAGLALVPVFVEALALLRDASAHVIARPPSLHVFEHALRWNVVLILGGGAFILSRVFRWKRNAAPGWSPMALVLGWWLCPALSLFVFSWITGNSVFLPRYLSPMLPGVALTGAAVAAYFVPAGLWKRLALILGAGVFLLMGQWGRFSPPHAGSDWRGAAREVNARILDSGTPVMCPSPFIEARPPEWRPDYGLPGFLYSHLDYYPVQGRTLLLPFETSPEAESYATAISLDALPKSRRFLLYGWNVSYWQHWLVSRPQFRYWTVARRDFGDVSVVEFNRPEGQ